MKQIKKVLKEIDLITKAYNVSDVLIDRYRTNEMYDQQRANQLVQLADMKQKVEKLSMLVALREKIDYDNVSDKVHQLVTDKLLQRCSQKG